MAGLTLPTLAQTTATYLAAIQSRLNQSLPQAPQALVNVLAAAEAMGDYVTGKYAADRFLAGFWSTAQGPDLDFLGTEYNLPRQTAVPATVTATLAATDGTIIPLGTVFNCQANGIQYATTAAVTAPYPGLTGTGVVLTLTAILPAGQGGVASNLAIGSSLNIANAIAGAQLVATVTATSVTGVDAELDAAYRVRGLALVQTTPTGSNAASYRLWGLMVPGVAMIYPYSGAPPSVGTSYPGQRTIYVECLTSVQADGITAGSWTPSTSVAVGLVGQVANAIKTNPNTGVANQDLGLVDSGLYVLPITRTLIYVTVTGLTVPSGATAACQADTTTAAQNYFLGIRPYISGVDPSFSRNDTATNPALSTAIQAILINYGAQVQAIQFGLAAGLAQPAYQVGQGEKLKLAAGTVTFA